MFWYITNNIFIECLGDIAMCANKINIDSDLYSKKKIDRWAHLTIHSVLHILGYTHENINNRKQMENKEIDILKKFNILHTLLYHLELLYLL